jgi:nucleotide-binding universal stress UspA family protein
MQVRRILVPTDFSKGSEAALAYAQTFAARFEADVVLLHVVAPHLPLREVPVLPFDVARGAADIARAAEGRLSRLAQAIEWQGRSTKTAVRHGTEDEQILAAAREEQADLIVMGTHGRTGLGRALLGSVAERVVRRAVCPVLTVPQGERALSDC